MTGSEMLTAALEDDSTEGQPKRVPLERSVSDYSERDVQCGFWICRGKFWQQLASKKLYVLLFGIVGCLFGSTTSYFYGTLTTVEKSIQISSKNAGIIMAGSDLSFVLSSLFLSYYASNRRKPLWIALGITSMGLSCFVNALPHFFYGPKLEDLMQIVTNITDTSKNDNLCNELRPPPDCSSDIGNLKPQMLLFLGSFLSGLGTSLYFTLGLTYLDDNVRKEKVPFLSSLSAFGRRLGPMVGFSLASLCLKFFVFPTVDPGYGTTDPRWIGAWWSGWMALGTTLLVVAPIFAGFPKMLPRAAERKSLSRQASRMSGAAVEEEEQPQASIGDLLVTLKRLITNKAYIFNNTASIFYFFGYMPYFLFQAKYIEIQYRLTPSQANMVTGSASLVFSALGILIAGAVIQKVKPTSRHLAAWNIFTSICSAGGIFLYSFLGCNALNNASIVSNSQGATCSVGCNCDFVKYAPICGSDGNTYLSPCHAGCKDQFKQPNGTIFYSSCSCIQNPLNMSYASFQTNPFNDSTGSNSESFGTAISGSCPVDCMTPFYLFLLVMCITKFISGTESAANFLIGLRCVEPRDKAISMGFSMAINTLFSFLPAPIVFGMIIDKTCVLWGRTCSKQGNCWLYDGLALRSSMNHTAAVFVIIGTFFDLGTWWYSKNFRIFDEEEKQVSEKGNAAEDPLDPYSRSGKEQKELVVLIKEQKE
ncbi:solute carrier organic anion transporter family member 74D-like [Wyeomyia smithii]|uniref:solute carrier organic anion transporter family member 74D-like n=1 Tax=Wyeomyia smithii TaxID=174621 RepID=UPI002467B421|nr:solute carrier organic anion transporter family member 74D-like [Wyeomyia smithii]